MRSSEISKKRWNKGILYLYVGLAIVYVFDYVSTIINRPLMPYLEANILWQTGGTTLYVIVNAALLYGAYKFYMWSTNPFIRYQIMWIGVWIIAMKISAGINNIQIYLDPPPLESVQHITQSQRNAYVYAKYYVGTLVWYLIGWGSYLFWSYDHDVTTKN
jgi:hypothetical protein